jgi:hypothetical protein
MLVCAITTQRDCKMAHPIATAYPPPATATTRRSDDMNAMTAGRQSTTLAEGARVAQAKTTSDSGEVEQLVLGCCCCRHKTPFCPTPHSSKFSDRGSEGVRRRGECGTSRCLAGCRWCSSARGRFCWMNILATLTRVRGVSLPVFVHPPIHLSMCVVVWNVGEDTSQK